MTNRIHAICAAMDDIAADPDLTPNEKDTIWIELFVVLTEAADEVSAQLREAA